MKSKTNMRRSIRRNGSRCLLEQLEARTLFNGNVTASVASGILNLQGNNLNNSIVVAQTSTSTTGFTVSSGDGSTTINGKSTPQAFTGVTGITTKLGCGNDTVLIENATGIAGNVQITASNGNQNITLDNVVVGGNFTLTNSGGQNQTTVENSTIDGSATVTAGAGFNCQGWSCWGCSSFNDANEIFTLSHCTVQNNLSISNVSGETTTDIEYSTVGSSTVAGSTVEGNVTITNGASSYGNCGFHCDSSSAAGDLFTMNYSTIANNVTISNDSDGNTTNIGNVSTIGGNLTVSNLVGTASQCCFNSCFSGNLANASDSFTLNGASSVMGNALLANVSDGAMTDIDGASSIDGTLTINNGVGSYGQGFTSCCGQTSTDYGDLFTMSGDSYVGSDVSISNGSTYNDTKVLAGSTITGSLKVGDGLNLSGRSTDDRCGGGGYGCGCGGCGGGYSYQSVYTTDLFTLDGSFVINNLAVSNASGYTDTAITDGAFVGSSVVVADQNGVAYFEMDSSFIGANLLFTAGSGITVVDVTSSTISGSATVIVSTGASVSIASGQVAGAVTITV